MSDDFTPDEIAAFSALSDAEKKDIERFVKWAGQKENPAEKNKPESPASPQNSDLTAFDLKHLKMLLADPEALSILDYLRASKLKSPKVERGNGSENNPPAKPLSGFLTRVK